MYDVQHARRPQAAAERLPMYDVRFANNAQQSCGRRVTSADALPEGQTGRVVPVSQLSMYDCDVRALCTRIFDSWKQWYQSIRAFSPLMNSSQMRLPHTCSNKVFSGLIQPISSREECEIHHLPPRNAHILPKLYIDRRTSYLGGILPPTARQSRA